MTSYGILAFASAWLSLYLAYLRLTRASLSLRQTSWVILLVTAGTIVGMRLVDITRQVCARGELSSEMLWPGGWSFMGGMIGAVFGMGLAAWLVGVSSLVLLDALVPLGAVSQVIGRLGCLFAGCCVGKTTDLPIGIRYSDPSVYVDANLPVGSSLHPVQLYLVLVALLAIACCRAVESRRMPPGLSAASAWCVMAVGRVIADTWRARPMMSFHVVGATVTGSQVVALVTLVGLLSWALLRRRYGSFVSGRAMGGN